MERTPKPAPHRILTLARDLQRRKARERRQVRDQRARVALQPARREDELAGALRDRRQVAADRRAGAEGANLRAPRLGLEIRLGAAAEIGEVAREAGECGEFVAALRRRVQTDHGLSTTAADAEDTEQDGGARFPLYSAFFRVLCVSAFSPLSP